MNPDDELADLVREWKEIDMRTIELTLDTAEKRWHARSDARVMIGTNVALLGMIALTTVGPLIGLCTVTRPSSAAARSTRPASPWPLPRCAPPMPSSTISARTTPPRAPRAGGSRVMVTLASVACACLATFVSASSTMK
jgi:hypothetical protein